MGCHTGEKEMRKKKRGKKRTTYLESNRFLFPMASSEEFRMEWISSRQ
jgi:hypothetical protein